MFESPDLSVGDFLESDAGFVWMEAAGGHVYSCYFSPGDLFEVFETQVLLLEESLSEAVGRSLIGIGDWSVLEETTLSDHRCIEFNLERRQAVDKGRGSEGRGPSWNTRRLCRDRPRVHLKATRLIDELGWVEPAGALEDTVR